MASDQDRLIQARDLIKDKRYAEARQLLKSINHPKAKEWLAKLDTIDPPPAPSPQRSRTSSGPSWAIVVGALLIGILIGGGLVYVLAPPADDTDNSTTSAAIEPTAPPAIDPSTDTPTADHPPDTPTEPSATITTLPPTPSPTDVPPPAPTEPIQPWHDRTVAAATFANGGQSVISVDVKGRILHWDSSTGAVLAQMLLPDIADEMRAETMSLSVSPDSRYLAVENNSRAYLFDLSTGGLLHIWTSSSPVEDSDALGKPEYVRFWPDGRLLLRADSGRQWVLADPATPATLTRLARVEVSIGTNIYGDSVGLSPTNDTLAVGRVGDEADILLIDVASASLRPELVGHQDAVTEVIFFSDGRRLLSAGADGTVRVWDTEIGIQNLLLGELSYGYATVRGLALSPDEQRIASAYTTRDSLAAPYTDRKATSRVDVWDANTGQLLQSIDFPYAIYSLEFASNSRELLVAGGNQNVVDSRHGLVERVVLDGPSIAQFYGVEVMRPSRTLGEEGRVDAVSISVDGSRLAVTLRNCSTQLYNPDGWAQVASWTEPHQCVSGSALNPDGTTLAVRHREDPTMAVVNAATGAERYALPDLRHPRDLAFAPDGQALLVGTHVSSARATLLDAATGATLMDFVQPTDSIYAVHYSADGSRFLLAWYPGEILVYDAATNQPIKLLKLTQGEAQLGRGQDAALSADGRYLAASSTTGFDVWEVESGTHIRYTPLNRYPSEVALSPDGRYTLTREVEVIRVWDNTTGHLRAVLLQDTLGFALAPDGSYVVTRGDDVPINVDPILPLIWETPLLVPTP